VERENWFLKLAMMKQFHKNEWAWTRRVRQAPSSQPKRDEYDL